VRPRAKQNIGRSPAPLEPKGAAPVDQSASHGGCPTRGFCSFFTAVVFVICVSATSAAAQSTGGKANGSAADRKAALVNAGRIVFNQRCEICHFVDSSAQKIGPGLKGLFARTRLADGTRISESSVANVISDGGKDMPGFGELLKPGQLQALITYLKSHE
jgi:cytochrome c